jgi:hypothetical protein
MVRSPGIVGIMVAEGGDDRGQPLVTLDLLSIRLLIVLYIV